LRIIEDVIIIYGNLSLKKTKNKNIQFMDLPIWSSFWKFERLRSMNLPLWFIKLHKTTHSSTESNIRKVAPLSHRKSRAYHKFCLKTISRRKVTPYPSNFQLSKNLRNDNIIHKFSQQQNIIISLITFYYYNFSKKVIYLTFINLLLIAKKIIFVDYQKREITKNQSLFFDII
jgi:hypothetical protein